MARLFASAGKKSKPAPSWYVLVGKMLLNAGGSSVDAILIFFSILGWPMTYNMVNGERVYDSQLIFVLQTVIEGLMIPYI